MTRPLTEAEIRTAIRESFDDDIPARHALDHVQTPEAYSGPWAHPPRKPRRHRWIMPLVLMAGGTICATLIAILIAQ